MNYENLDIKNVVPVGNRFIGKIDKKEIMSKDGKVLLGYTNTFDEKEVDYLPSRLVEILQVGEGAELKKGYPFGLCHNFTGSYVYTTQMEALYKLFNDQDIHCYFKTEEMKLDELKPKDGMLLLDVTKKEFKDKNGIIIPDRVSDPREGDLEMATVIGIADNIKGYKVGDMVFFSPGTGYKFVSYDNDEPVDVATISAQDIVAFNK